MIEFSPFRIDLDEERVWNGSKLLSLRRKPFAILRYLVANPRRLVTQDELITEVWNGTVVSDSAVRSHLHELRSVLGDGVIETVIGRGYRFIAELSVPATAAPARTERRVDRLVVGRDAELARLRAAFERASAGHRQVCFVTGDPGIGKTTLVDAFLDEVADLGGVAARGQCIEQFGAPEAYLAIIEAARELPNGAKILDAIERGGPKILREITGVLEEAATTDTVVIALEDMQWSDLATIDLLANLGQRKERAKLVVIVTARQGDVGVADHPMNHVMRSLVARSNAHAVLLDRIAASEIDHYVAARFSGHAFPTGLVAIVDRITEGTPLFVVSLLDDLVRRAMVREDNDGWRLEASLDDVAAVRPDGVRQLIDVQLDRLEPDEQRALEAASMIGIQFSSTLVAAALEKPLEAIEELLEQLARRGLFVRREASEDWPDGSVQTRYRVTHGLVQEVATTRVSLARRQRWNRLIGERLEAAWGERAGEIGHVLAVHYDHGQVPSRAVAHYIAAGELDARRYAIPDSLRLFGRARELIARVPPSPERDRQALIILRGLAASVIRSPSPEMRDPMAMFDEMTELAARIDDKIALFTALVNVEVRLCILAEYERATKIEVQIDALAAQTELPPQMRGFADVARALRLFWMGKLADAKEVLERCALDPAKTGDATKFGIIGPTDQRTIVRVYLSFTRWLVGDESAMEMAIRAADDARVAGDPYAHGVALSNVARLHLMRQDSPALVRSFAEQTRSITGAEAWHAQAAVLRACGMRRERHLDAAEADALVAVYEERAAVYPMGKTLFGAFLLDALRGAPRDAVSLEIVEGLLRFAAQHDERLVEPELLRLRGEIREPRERDAAERDYLAAIELARASGAIGLERRAMESLARLRAC